MGSLSRRFRLLAAAGGLLVGLMAVPAASAQEVVVARIHEIQGAAHLSSFSGQDVSGVEGIVTVERSSQFWMQDPTPDSELVVEALEAAGLAPRSVLAAVAGAGLTAVGELFHRFPGAPGAAPDQGGATGVVLLAESHVAVHTWPELHAVTLDVYVCNFGADNTARAHTLMTQLEACFSPGRIERHALQRGAA